MFKRYSYTTSDIETRKIGQVVDEMMNTAQQTRQGHERRWYDNDFFYDGYHFRYVSRERNKIIDVQEKATLYSPFRAIPKASRQIDGITNLLVSNNYTPVVYPEKIDKRMYELPKMYEVAKEEAKTIARNSGHWLEEEFKNQDIHLKVPQMVILSARNSISYMQVWPDAINEKIKTQVCDAFDIYVLGNYTELEDVPFIIKATPRLISEIKADENFDKEQLEQLNPDNRFASSEIKEAYMSARFGGRAGTDKAATIIQKEAFIKEYLNEDNEKMIKKQENAGEILRKRKRNDPVIRHTFVAGNIWLLDEYLDAISYPFVEFRFKPGPLYQTPLIERFISSNKSLDMVVSRVERSLHTMGVGIWTKRQGEQFNISNQAGGQIVEYKTTPPGQVSIQGLPPSFWQYIGVLNSFIEEQGLTTLLSKLPTGVKGWQAIESLKESEYSQLVIASARLKDVYKKIAYKFLDLADDYFVTPQIYFFLEKGEPQYFDIIGKNALKKREEVKLETPAGLIPLSKEYRVDIEVQAGLAYTKEGRKAAAKEIGDYLIQLAQLGLVPPQVVVQYIENLFEIYEFGQGSEIIKNVESFVQQGMVGDPQMDKIKLGLAQVIQDTGLAEQNEARDIEKAKIGAAQAISDIQAV